MFVCIFYILIMLNITYNRTTKLFTYHYKDKNITFDNFENLYWLKDTLNGEKINWKIDEDTQLLYCLDNDANKIYLIEKILNTKINNKEIIFIDNDPFNYYVSNLKVIDLTTIKRTKSLKNEKTNDKKNEKNQNNLPENFPNNYYVIESFEGHKIFAGKKAGQTFNPYWLVYDKNDSTKTNVFLMSSNENQNYFIFSQKSIDYVKNRTWFLSENGYITTVEKNEEGK